MKNKYVQIKSIFTGRMSKVVLILAFLFGLLPGLHTTALAAAVDAEISISQSGTSLSLRVDYGKTVPIPSIAPGDTIEIRMTADASSIVKLVGFGGTSAAIYAGIGEGGALVQVGTRTYSYSGDTCVLTVVFNSAFSDAGLTNIWGWYTADARIEYKDTTGSTSTDVTITINGAGSGKADVKVSNLSARLAGAGNLDLSGSADSADFKLSGAGNLDALGLQTLDSVVELSGVGTVKLSCSENLKVDADGAGAVEYRGSPRVDFNIDGLVSVRKI